MGKVDSGLSPFPIKDRLMLLVMVTTSSRLNSWSPKKWLTGGRSNILRGWLRSYEAENPVMTANQIITAFGMKDPALNYLVLLHGHDPISYKDKGCTADRL
jgi:hypothetical protein